jgi:O-antigen ligase
MQLRYTIPSFLGMLFALLVWKIMNLSFRYGAAISAGIIVISVCMMLTVYGLLDFLVLAQVFNIPFAEFAKWLFVHPEDTVIARGISLGLAEILILISYAAWFARIFVARIEPFPKPNKVDVFVFLFIAVQIISLLGARNRELGMLDIIWNFKYALIYFFISRKVERKHLKWIIICFLFAIMVESPIALYERLTGNVGIGYSKGDMSASTFGTQYDVPGIEYEPRSAGTTNDSHSLGLYYSMLLPVPFVFAGMRLLKPSRKVLLALVFAIGVSGLVVTFSRSGWLAFAISIALAMCIMLFSWRQGGVVITMIAVLLIAGFFYPKAYNYIYVRIVEAPFGILESRFDMNWTAFHLWLDNFFFGYGPANYVTALNDPNVRVFEGRYDLPVHNAFLWVASENGLFGVVFFFGVILLAMWRCIKQFKCSDLLIRGLALAIFTALLSYLLDGLSNPMFKVAVPYSQLWIYIALSVSFTRLLSGDNHDSAASAQV